MLTGKQKSNLRKLANSMQPIVQVGKSGIGTPLIQTVEKALDARELIKLSVLQNCLEEPKQIAEEISNLTQAEVIQIVGRVIVLYKRSSKRDNRAISKQL